MDLDGRIKSGYDAGGDGRGPLRRERDGREFVDLGEFGGGFEVVAAERHAHVIELAGVGGGKVRRPAGAVVEEFNGDFGGEFPFVKKFDYSFVYLLQRHQFRKQIDRFAPITT